jgi:hypothetical protein
MMKGFLKIKKTYVIGFVIWFLAMSTPFAFRSLRNNFLKKQQKIHKKNLGQYKSFHSSLSEKQKSSIYYRTTGAIKIGENDFMIVGSGQNNEALDQTNNVILKKLDYRMIDIRALAIRSSIREISPKLNNAERALLNDFYGTILINDNDEFFVVFNNAVYSKYILKYGTDCESCDKASD